MLVSYLIATVTTFIFVEKIRRFVVTEFVKLSDKFDIVHKNKKNKLDYFFCTGNATGKT